MTITQIITPEKIYLFLGVFLAVCLLVVGAVMLDLWDGIHTARKTGERIHSHKLRVTIAKISEYWRFVTIGFLVDCIGVLFSFYVLPFIAMAFGLGLIVVESKSMFEHARRRKSHTTELPDILASIVAATHEKDAEAVVKRLTEVITEQDKASKFKANINEQLNDLKLSTAKPESK